MNDIREDSVSILKSLEGQVVESYTCCLGELECGDSSDYGFIHSSSCIIVIEGSGESIELQSLDFEGDYTLYAKHMTRDERKQRVFELEELSVNLVECEDVRGDCFSSVKCGQVSGDVLNVHFEFEGGEELIVFSGGLYETSDGYEVVKPDEMLLVFQKGKDYTQYGLSR